MSAQSRGTPHLWSTAVVGASIYVLAGGAIAIAGPSAILALLFNGGILLLSALSLAELEAHIPASDGPYPPVRTVLTPGGAFAVSWLAWLACVSAAAFYALGFAVLLMPTLENWLPAVGYGGATGISPRLVVLDCALGALVLVTRSPRKLYAIARTAMTVAVVGSLVVVTLGSAFALIDDADSVGDVLTRFTPFFPSGVSGVVQVMGYTFVALQGVVAFAATGAGRTASRRTVSRTMLRSVTASLVLGIPFLIVLVAVAGPESVASAAAHGPELFMADAATRFLGPPGYWLVLAAGSLTMLVALRAQLLVAERIAARLVVDGTLPPRLSGAGSSPVALTNFTAAVVGLLLLALPDLSVAASLSSMSTLGAFALAHGACYRVPPAREREPRFLGTRLHRAIPLVGGALCLATALFQSTAVPTAGFLVSLWLAIGAALYGARPGRPPTASGAGGDRLW